MKASHTETATINRETSRGNVYRVLSPNLWRLKLVSRWIFVVRAPVCLFMLFTLRARREMSFAGLSAESRAADTSSAVFSSFLPCHLLTLLKYFIKYFDAAVITWPYWLTFNLSIPFLLYLTLPYPYPTFDPFLFRTSRPTFPETLELAVKLAYSEVSQFNGWVPQRAELSNLLSSRADVLKQLVQTM